MNSLAHERTIDSARKRQERSARRPPLSDVILGAASVIALIVLLVWAVI